MVKKFRVIAKVGNEKFVKYKVNDLRKFASFLDGRFPDWRYFNVYRYTKNSDGEKLASFTKNRRPRSAWLSN